MHVIIFNPDGIGDVILRLPLFTAVAEAGHEVTVICRPHAEHFVRRAANFTQIALLRPDPYEAMRMHKKEIADDFLGSLHISLTPNTLLVFGAYQWTIFEEKLATIVAEAGGSRLRLNGFRYLGGRIVHAPGAERVIAVDEDAHESEKNHVLAEAILGRPVVRRDPVLVATADDVERGRARMRRENPTWVKRMTNGRYWIGLMGNAGDYYGEVKDWGYENWVEVARHLVSRGDGLLLTGSDAERESLERIQRLSGGSEAIAIATGDITTEEGTSVLLGLTSSAHAYIGKDSGPMHVAAALGKPVISLFGGGHWARFTPMVTPSLAVAVEMPCAPCGWFCGRSESFCVKLVPTARVTAAVDAVLEGSASRRVVELLPRNDNAFSWKGL